MADRVSVMAFTLVCDEKKGGLEKRRISAMGRFLLPSLKETSRLFPVYSKSASENLFPHTRPKILYAFGVIEKALQEQL